MWQWLHDSDSFLIYLPEYYTTLLPFPAVEKTLICKFVLVEEKLQAKLDTLKKRAGESGTKAKLLSHRRRSSLHQIIRTKKQADRFMKLLKSA